jgi:OOP family OmpA-OmpF porin
VNTLRHSVIALVLFAFACGESPRPAQSTPQPSSGSQATPSTPNPAPAAHTEVVLNNGHITLNHQIQFETNSDVIRETESASVLNDLVGLLRENAQIRRVRVEGHADVRGDAAANQSLSQRRAAAVAAYLRGHGFESITFEPVGLGNAQPLCREDTDECHERNRRVELTITEPAPAAAQ